MYFANMYCYGHDNDKVGITGIRGCIGVIYKGQGAMFAVHIPDNGPDENKAGGQAFAQYVLGQQNQAGKGHGELYLFANGANRPTADQEAQAIKKLLKKPQTTVCRIMKHLGQNSGTSSADSVAVMMEPVNDGVAIWYKRNDDINWVQGGKAEAGQYKNRPAFSGDDIPDNLNSHWWRVSEINCSLTKI